MSTKINNNGWTFGFTLLCVGFICLSAGAEPANKMLISVGYSTTGTEVDQRDADAALKVWAQEIGETYGFQVKTTLYESMEQMVKDFIDKKLDYVTMHTADYLKYASVFKVRAEMARSINKKITVKYLLMVNTDKNVKGLSDLKNTRLAVKKNNNLGMMFLDTQLMRAKLPKSDRFFSAVQEKPKENQVALAVFFGQADACIITDIGFATMTELNPQMGRKLKVLASSPDLVEFIGFFSKDYPPQNKEIATNGIIKGTKASKRAKQIMLLFNTDSMEPITENQLESVRTLVAEYNRLKGIK